MRKAICLIALLLLLSAAAATAQKGKIPDAKSIVSQGRLNGLTYTNDYFHVAVHIPSPNTSLRANAMVAEDRAQLLEAANSDGDTQQRHVFVLTIHTRTEVDPEYGKRFVRSVRHMYEREGFETVTAESVITYAGRTFIYSALKKKAVSSDVEYYKGICFTELNGYMFGYWGEASSQEQLNKLMDLKTRLEFH